MVFWVYLCKNNTYNQLPNVYRHCVGRQLRNVTIYAFLTAEIFYRDKKYYHSIWEIISLIIFNIVKGRDV